MPRLKWDAKGFPEWRRSTSNSLDHASLSTALEQPAQPARQLIPPSHLSPFPPTEPFVISTQIQEGYPVSAHEGALVGQSECHWRRTLPQNHRYSSKQQRVPRGANTSYKRHQQQTPGACRSVSNPHMSLVLPSIHLYDANAGTLTCLQLRPRKAEA